MSAEAQMSASLADHMLRSMKIPSLRDVYVCREAIYNAIYTLPVGEVRKESNTSLRQGQTTRRPCSGIVNRRGQISRYGQLSCTSAGS